MTSSDLGHSTRRNTIALTLYLADRDWEDKPMRTSIPAIHAPYWERLADAVMALPSMSAKQMAMAEVQEHGGGEDHRCTCDPPRSAPGTWVAHQPGCPERDRLRALVSDDKHPPA